MDRLTVEDMLMLWPDDAWPQEVGAVGVLDGGPLLEPDGSLRIAAVRRAVQARLHLVPRLRQVLRAPRRGLGRCRRGHQVLRRRALRSWPTTSADAR